jgi:hypothetical protein
VSREHGRGGQTDQRVEGDGIGCRAARRDERERRRCEVPRQAEDPHTQVVQSEQPGGGHPSSERGDGGAPGDDPDGVGGEPESDLRRAAPQHVLDEGHEERRGHPLGQVRHRPGREQHRQRRARADDMEARSPLVPRTAQTRAVLLVLLVSVVRVGGPEGGPRDQRDQGGGRHERGGVHGKGAAQAERGDEDATQWRGDQARRRAGLGHRGVPGHEVGLVEKLRDERRVRGSEHQAHGRLEERDGVHQPELHLGRRREKDPDQARPDEVGDHHRRASVPAVHQHARHRSEEQRGQRLGGEERPGRDHRPGLLVHVERQGHRDDPVADLRQEPGEPNEDEGSVSDQRQAPASGGSCSAADGRHRLVREARQASGRA